MQCFYIVKPRLLSINLDVCGKTANREVKKFHKPALSILFNDYEASFDELLKRKIEQTTNLNNLHKLLTEVYKFLNCQNPAFMWDLFIRKKMIYDLRAKDLLQLLKAKTFVNGFNWLQREYSLELYA